MTAYVPPLDDIRFALRHMAGLEQIARLPGCEAATPDLVDQVLEEAGKFAANELAPLNATGDQEGARIENGAVRTPRASGKRTGNSSKAAGTDCRFRRSGAARDCPGAWPCRSGRCGTARTSRSASARS